MKKNFLLQLFIAGCMLSLMMHGCTKAKDSSSYETRIKFTYNGQEYTRTSPSRILSDLLNVQNEFLLVNFLGLEIEDENNVLGGTIVIFSRSTGIMHCAYLRPTGTSVSATYTDCMLYDGANPVDSVQVYWYESGSINFSYSDCKDLTYAIVSGQKDCAISGTFNLTLTNKINQKIILTNGTFSGRIRIYH
jgi:hypothetical protein